MKLVLVPAAALLAALSLAAPAAAEEVTVPGCATYAGPTPDVGYGVPVVSDVAVCAFESATVTADADPVEESTSCAYGPSIHVMGPTAQVDGFAVAASYTVDGTPAGGTLYQPPVVVDVETEGYDSGPLWMIPC